MVRMPPCAMFSMLSEPYTSDSPTVEIAYMAPSVSPETMICVRTSTAVSLPDRFAGLRDAASIRVHSRTRRNDHCPADRHVRLDQHDGAPARLEAIDQFIDLVDHDRRKSQRGLADHQNLAAAHQAAPDP